MTIIKTVYSLSVIGLLLLVGVIDSHNWLSWPVSRANQRATQTGCRLGGEGNPTCAGPCDKSVSQMSIAPITAQRGQTLQINWNRHNHPGGFIRFAWSPTSQSDSHSSFDSRVDRVVCKEIGGCGPADPNSPTGDSNGVDCGTTIEVPLWLTDGAWTLQWAYFGGWYNAGDYYACVDYTISGGPTSTQSSPVYIGGDFTYPHEDVCLFYSTNALHVCKIEPCTTGTFAAGNQKGPAAGFSNSPSPSPSPSPVTTAKLTTKALTTSKHTTGAHSLTTGVHSVTTGVHSVTTSKRAATTSKVSITTSQHSTSSTSQHSTTTTSTSTSTSTTTTGNDAMCYLPGTPNLNGRIHHDPPTCGKKSPRARCADGQCCSRYGYCGPFADENGNYYEEVNGHYTHVSATFALSLYCNKTSGDYRKVPCSSIANGQYEVVNNDKQTGTASSLLNINFYMSFVLVALVWLMA